MHKSSWDRLKVSCKNAPLFLIHCYRLKAETSIIGLEEKGWLIHTRTFVKGRHWSKILSNYSQVQNRYPPGNWFFKNISPTIVFIMFWNFLMFCQILLLLQVKWSMITTYKHGIYKLLHELPNDLRFWNLRNWKILGKCLNTIEW